MINVVKHFLAEAEINSSILYSLGEVEILNIENYYF